MKKYKVGFWVTCLGILGHLILFLLSKMIEVEGAFRYLTFITTDNLLPLVILFTLIIFLGFFIAYRKDDHE